MNNFCCLVFHVIEVSSREPLCSCPCFFKGHRCEHYGRLNLGVEVYPDTYEPVEAWKTALEGSAVKTGDEICKAHEFEDFEQEKKVCVQPEQRRQKMLAADLNLKLNWKQIKRESFSGEHQRRYYWREPLLASCDPCL